MWTFLGQVSYSCRFVPHFAALTAPLADLTNVTAPRTVHWTSELDEVSTETKVTLYQQRVLLTPILLQANASTVSLGTILAQTFQGVEHRRWYLFQKLQL